MRARAGVVWAAGCLLVAGLLGPTGPAVASSVAAGQLPGLLTVRADDTTHVYNRDSFRLWIDANGDDCDTREEVLIAESTTPVTKGSGCALAGGTWVSPYDGATWTDPADLQIDYTVPLAEAWASGAWSWTPEQRMQYANDLAVPYALIAATSAVHESKGDRDPAQWLPSNTTSRCQYVLDWALVKYRWSLTVDPAEESELQSVLSGTCGASPVTLPTVMASVAAAAGGGSVTPLPDGSTRLAGASRYETAVTVSGRYAAGVPAVFVATGSNFPDALSAAAAASLLGGPLLLTQPTTLPAVVRSEIQRLAPARIYVVGGTGAVSAGVFATLNSIAPTSRLGGTDRYATGLGIVNGMFSASTTAFIATGRSFPDALAATGAAGSRQAPVILVDGSLSSLSPATLAALTGLGVSSATIAGGTGAVSAGIESQLRHLGYSVVRYGGATRYDTAASINSALFPAGSTDTMFLATGADFPDALAGAALAGRLSAPLFITPATCAPTSVHDAVATLAAPKKAILGGTAVVSNTAASNTECNPEPWATTGWALNTDAVAPYSDRPPVDVTTTAVDSTGLVIFMRPDNGQRGDHPVAYAQYGIAALLTYQSTGDAMWLQRAERQAQQLIAIHTQSGDAWWFPYSFDWPYGGDRVVKAPWWSGMAQGQALSLFVRLAETTGDQTWETAARHTWASFMQRRSSTPWFAWVLDDHLYFEEYASTNEPPLRVLNGHIFAIFGVYDYWRHTGDPVAEQYIDGAATTVLVMMPLIRDPGGVSYYCADPAYCQRPLWQNQTYHVIHSWQLDTLARITGDPQFSTWAGQLRTDWAPS